MYYVIQVAPGMEDRTESWIRGLVNSQVYDRCFHPMRHVRKKFHGEWKDMHEKLLPGYVFLVSRSIEELYQELKQIPVLTKMLGKDGGQFTPLSKRDIQWLQRITAGKTENDGSREAGLSQVAVSEAGEITVLSGPLKQMEGQIRKIYLHKRVAEVEVDFMDQKTVIHLGIELVKNQKREYIWE